MNGMEGIDALMYFWAMPAGATLTMLIFTILVFDREPLSSWTLEDWMYIILTSIVYPIGLRAVFLTVRSHLDESDH